MKIVSIGGGPAGLYLAILMKKADPAHDITIVERNKPGDTFGFGVVFSDETLGNFAEADPESYEAITAAFAHWTDIDIHFRGQVVTSTGHGFSGMARVKLLDILGARAASLGVKFVHERDVKDVTEFPDADLILAADGVNSAIRAKYEGRFKPTLDWRRNKFVWLGTTRPHPAFTFHFKEHASGLFRVHAYQYDKSHSTFIVETTEDTWKRAGLDTAGEADTLAFCENLFAEELAGHRLIANRSIWRTFPTIRCAHWHFDNVVLMGDAVHTAHFSIGSGTKLAMEDSIELAKALNAHKNVRDALAAYEAVRASRRPNRPSARRKPRSNGSRRPSAIAASIRSISPSRCSPARCASPTRTSSYAIPPSWPESTRDSPNARACPRRRRCSCRSNCAT
jgi:anthraniloyl-CoA monooxygenase